MESIISSKVASGDGRTSYLRDATFYHAHACYLTQYSRQWNWVEELLYNIGACFGLYG